MTPYNYIKKEIITGNFKPGSVFDESKITAVLNCSRTPVREAVLKLCEEGYLTIIPRKGTLISNISITDIKEVYEFRIILESSSIRHIKKIDLETLIKWKEYFENILSNKEIEAPLELDDLKDDDKAFHLFIISQLKNNLMTNELTKLMDKSARIRYLSNEQNQNRFKSSIEEHLEIIDSLLNNDLENASEQMKLHLKKSLEGYNF